jgi:hypothetical protein
MRKGHQEQKPSSSHKLNLGAWLQRNKETHTKMGLQQQTVWEKIISQELSKDQMNSLRLN